MLALDGAALDMGGRKFTYDLPAPFGPGRGPAYLKVVARPAASVNTQFRAAFDEIQHQARVRDFLTEKKRGDAEAFIRAQDEDRKWVGRQVFCLSYDHCVISWESNIQNGGKDIEPTRDNFLALSEFPHPAIAKVMSQLQRDIDTMDNFTLEAEREAAEAEVKN